MAETISRAEKPASTVRPSAAALSTPPPAHSLEELLCVQQRFQEFAYIVSHDLHAPLRMIVSFAGMLQDKTSHDVGAEEESDYLAHIMRAGKQMQEKLDGLLHYSRLNTMAQPPTEDLDCALIVQNCLALFKDGIAEKKARISVSTLPQIRADVDQLHQLFTFLLDNALKFSSPRRAPEIRIEAKAQSDGWLFSVADNGIGIESPYREDAFKLFRQLNREDAYPGIGMGLTLARKIVERLGGKIWIEDGMSGGTKVCFTVPRES